MQTRQSSGSSTLEGDENSRLDSQSSSLKRFVLLVTTYFMLIVMFSVFLRIPVYIPTQWVTGVVFFYLAPILLYSFSTLARPWVVLAICIPSICLGELLWCAIYGCAGELFMNVMIALNSWGVGCLLISLFRNRGETMAMLFGALWSFLGMLLPSLMYYSVVLTWNPLYIVAVSLFTMILNLVVVPISLLLNHIFRRGLTVTQLDDMLPLDILSVD